MLLTLWHNSLPASFFRFRPQVKLPPVPVLPDAVLAVEGGFVDYFHGRVIKIDFRKRSAISSDLYDRDMKDFGRPTFAELFRDKIE